ncbi:phosphomannomutase [Microlunatus sagamiharensis]|uniref:Phosphomannomutase n=1 Tax=Microlunatus sagamiharensis TaxID=546874 RepID=A0A1H2LLL2_9ACTN|nr:phosphomannomutase/phosphoglucomutase [Microlunatus sagamiharensis]SDU81893.1 phosphomannomutase [Microlunatus sagamiharensis]
MLKPVIFKANDIRGITEGDAPEWDEAGAYALGGALVEVFGLVGRSLVLGRDMRLSGPRMSAAFVEAVLDAGTDVVDVGLASTDELWFASGLLGLPGAMFTASHNPGAYNGIKFCHPGARPIDPAELVAIARRASAGPVPLAPLRGSRSESDVLGAYADHLHSLVDLTGIRPLRVVADAGNGMAGHTLPAVFPGGEGVPPVEVIGLFTDPDGSFPNHPANPLIPENLLDAQAAVREREADLALVFDGDADRCFIIDERGEVVSPSTVTALIAAQELDRHPGSAVVINKITSRSVAEVVAEHGGETVVTKVGHTFVKAAMAEHDAVFGGEHSAHYYFREFWGADTGMLAALHVLALVGRSQAPLSELAAGFSRYAASGEINSEVEDQAGAIDAVAAAFEGRGEADRVDGLTVSGPDWWVNVRPSNTEPLLRLNVEARTEDAMAELRDRALTAIRG